MSKEKREKDKSKGQSAKEVAEIMAANMKANMEDPEFWERNERIKEEALHKVLKARKLREQKREKDNE